MKTVEIKVHMKILEGFQIGILTFDEFVSLFDKVNKILKYWWLFGHVYK